MVEAPSEARGDGSGTLPQPTSRWDWLARFPHAVVEGVAHRAEIADVERFCFFIGYPRSGHSLVGSLLNAHPEILIAHELDAVGYVEHHFGRTQVFALLLERDRDFASMDRRWMGYDYVVPDQFQGRWTRLRVIGDKRARTATYRLAQAPHLLDRVRRVVGVPIRVVHVTRNPYDNVVTMARRTAAARGRGAGPDGPRVAADLSDAIDRYGQLCGWVDAIRRRLGAEELYEIGYETFVGRPAESLTALCSFLGVDAGESFLADCAGVVWPQVRRRRDVVEWSEADRGRVDELIGAHPFLGGYSWDS
jgi:hypothetical protein